MMRLKDVLEMVSANELKIKDLDHNEVIWKSSEHVNQEEAFEYQKMLERYRDYEVVKIKAQSVGRARNNIKSILVIEIQNDFG